LLYTYSPRSCSSVLVTHALANGVVPSTRHAVVYLGCTHFPSIHTHCARLRHFANSLVVRLKRSLVHDNDEPLSLTSSASSPSINPPGQRGYRVHYNSLLPDIPPHLSPSPPAPVCVISPSGRQLILPPSTPAAAVVVSLAIGATSSVGTTFGVGRITRHVERRFDVWRLRWVRAAAARRGGVESRSVVSSGGNDAEGSAPLEVEDYLQRDIDSLCEAMLLSIQSDVRQYLRTKGYNMSIPPTTHWEAERWMDAEGWRKVTKKELKDLKRMGVYKDAEELPEGKPESHVWYRLLRKTFETFGFSRSEFDHDYTTRKIWIHQELHIDSLLAEHNMTSCNAVVTPLDPSYPLRRESDTYPTIDNLTHAYQHSVGSLLFLQLCSRPNISFAVLLALSQFCSSTLPHHYAVARWVLRYPLSSTEAEYGALSSASNDSSHGCAKYIDTHHHLIHSHIENGDIDIRSPFPVTTPHGKIYSVLFFGQNLARRSDIHDTRWILKANSIDSVSLVANVFSIDNYSTPLFFGPRVDRPHLDVTNVPDLPRNTASIVHLEHLDTESSPAPVVMTPRSSHLQIVPSTPKAVRTLSREGSQTWRLPVKGVEKGIVAWEEVMQGVKETTTHLWYGVTVAYSANTLHGRTLRSWHADDYLQPDIDTCHLQPDIDSLYEATTNDPVHLCLLNLVQPRILFERVLGILQKVKGVIICLSASHRLITFYSVMFSPRHLRRQNKTF
jgi:hypothetical protein